MFGQTICVRSTVLVHEPEENEAQQLSLARSYVRRFATMALEYALHHEIDVQLGIVSGPMDA